MVYKWFTRTGESEHGSVCGFHCLSGEKDHILEVECRHDYARYHLILFYFIFLAILLSGSYADNGLHIRVALLYISGIARGQIKETQMNSLLCDCPLLFLLLMAL